MEDAQKILATATDNLDITRAREQFRAAAWRAEREFPHRWAQRNYIATQAAPDPDAGLLGSINDLLKRIANNTDPKPPIEAEDVEQIEPAELDELMQPVDKSDHPIVDNSER